MLPFTTLPLLRSDVQGRTLAPMYLHPEEKYRITDLVELSGTNVPSVRRETDQLVAAGYLISEKRGRNRYLSANVEHPLFSHVAAILNYGYGPVALLPELLAKVSNVEEAWVYGSWARRYLGEPVKTVNDLDLLVVGDVKRADLYDMAAEASSKLSIEVNPQPMTAERFVTADDAYTKTVRESPRVLVYRREVSE